mgnify:CR=1 FL=1|tara:strand:- start:1295 stop:1660 length:366 start_codon:yes stop_codon:yes gene_type:complete
MEHRKDIFDIEDGVITSSDDKISVLLKSKNLKFTTEWVKKKGGFKSRHLNRQFTTHGTYPLYTIWNDEDGKPLYDVKGTIFWDQSTHQSVATLKDIDGKVLLKSKTLKACKEKALELWGKK